MLLIIREAYVVKNLKVKMLIEMNILVFKKMIINLNLPQLQISSYQQLTAFLCIHS